MVNSWLQTSLSAQFCAVPFLFSSTKYYLLAWELSSGTTDRISSGRQVDARATLQKISRDLSRLRPSTTSVEESDLLDFSALLVSLSSDFL